MSSGGSRGCNSTPSRSMATDVYDRKEATPPCADAIQAERSSVANVADGRLPPASETKSLIIVRRSEPSGGSTSRSSPSWATGRTAGRSLPTGATTTTSTDHSGSKWIRSGSARPPRSPKPRSASRCVTMRMTSCMSVARRNRSATEGRLRMNEATMALNSVLLVGVDTRTSSDPSASWRAVRCTSSTASRARRAAATTVVPASVSTSRRPSRRKNASLHSLSRPCSARDSTGCEICNVRAAALNDSVSAAVTR